jgi:hypothetical protein
VAQIKGFLCNRTKRSGVASQVLSALLKNRSPTANTTPAQAETAGGNRNFSLQKRGGKCMSTRTRLNRAFFNGSLLLAGVVGVASGSFGIFAVTFAGLLAANVACREIRFSRRR